MLKRGFLHYFYYYGTTAYIHTDWLFSRQSVKGRGGKDSEPLKARLQYVTKDDLSPSFTAFRVV